MKASLKVFVAMPYEDRFNRVYTECILPIQERFPGWNIYIVRADTSPPTNELLWADVTSKITNSDLVIADASACNPNVMLEIGVALARVRMTIIITQDVDVPTNLAGHIRVHYKINELDELQNQLVFRINGVLEAVKKDRSQILKLGPERELGPGRTYWKDKKDQTTDRSNLPVEAIKFRRLGRAAKDEEMLEVAVDFFRKALKIEPAYWEAKYDLALVLSRLMFEEQAKKLAREVTEEATKAKDYLFAMKAHNLLSGIYKRTARYQEALDEIRVAYSLSHNPQLKGNDVQHIIPLKNRAALELLYGDKEVFTDLIKELMKHPSFEEVREELETEIGKKLK